MLYRDCVANYPLAKVDVKILAKIKNIILIMLNRFIIKLSDCANEVENIILKK